MYFGGLVSSVLRPEEPLNFIHHEEPKGFNKKTNKKRKHRPPKSADLLGGGKKVVARGN